MSHSYSSSAHRYAQPKLQHSTAAVSRHVQQSHRHGSDYTIVHAGRQVRIGPVAFWIVVGTLVVMGIWSIATGTYFAFSNDVLTRLIGRQADMQFAYEDRIAELRAQVDRITSRQMLDQEQFEKKLNVLLQRQQQLESRTQALTGELLTTGSIKPSKPSAPEPTPRAPKASPISDKVLFKAPPDREARLESRERTVDMTRLAQRPNAAGLEGTLARVQQALDRIEKKQVATLTDIEAKADSKVRAVQSVLSDLGADLGNKAPARAALGGPYVPVKPPAAGATTFERQIYRVHVARAQLAKVTQTLLAVPVRKPVVGDVDMSSPFGMRMDPFLRGPAIHTGLDLRGDTGDPVRVTANGTVTHAGWAGGYGNMVEVDHGNGFSTRYGHMSKIEVKNGQHVRIGETIGRIGSTGRSTGPHLHYETRINDQPVDPQKFLRAGLRLGTGVLGNNSI